jgi:cytidylate kinase
MMVRERKSLKIFLHFQNNKNNMIITISGMIGSGKSTVADEIAKKLGYKRYSSGDFMRKMAEEKKMTLAELSKEAETNPKIDKEIDRRQIELGKKEKDFVIDGRLSWHFIPNSVKVYLDVSNEEAARRIYNDKKETRKTEKFSSLEELTKEIQKRKESEIKRYKKYYGINYHDRKNYDIYLDTTNMTLKEEINSLMKEIKKFQKIIRT